MLKVGVLVAPVAGVSALSPEMRLFNDGMRQTVEVGRLLDAAEDAAKAAVSKCVVALMPPSITSFMKCIGVDLALVATGDAAAAQAASRALATLEAQGAALDKFSTVSKESCTALFSSKAFQCVPIMFASDPVAYLEKNPFPTSFAALPAGCADVKTIAAQTPGMSAQSDQQLAAPAAQGASNNLKASCGAQGGGKGFSDAKASFAQIVSECSKTGANPASQLSAEEATAAKAALGAPTNAAGLVASVVLAAVAVVVAL